VAKSGGAALREAQGAAPQNQKQRGIPVYNMALAAVAAGAILVAVVLVGLSTGRHRTDGLAVPTTRHITPLPQG
jgi:hypothetical protein